LEQQIKEYDGLNAYLDELDKQNASKGRIETQMNSYLDKMARKSGVPIRGTFELTPLCNLDCKMCYVHLSSEQMQVTNKKMLTGEQWNRIIDHAVDHGMLYALLTGGEALMHPDFDDIFLHLLNKGVLTAVNTNGSTLDDARIGFFKQHRPKAIQVSLYGDNEDNYEKVTGHRVFSKVLRTIDKLKNAGITVNVGITPNRYMVDFGAELLNLVDGLNVMYSVNAGLFRPREETGRADVSHDLTLDEYIHLYKLRAQMEGKVYKPVCQENLLPVGGSSKENPRGFRCGGGRSSFAVTWDGMMQPCLMMSDIKTSALEQPFSEAWNLVHQGALEYPFPQECLGCAYSSVCPACVKLHAEGASIGHANPAFCIRAKRLAAEGMIRL